ncbi:MAG: hypothetical protein ACR2PQ_12830, partial [Myxococcota bacterium]
ETVRDDGEGLGLRFRALGEKDAEQLAKMLDHLPVLSADSDGSVEPRVLAEVVEADDDPLGAQSPLGSD